MYLYTEHHGFLHSVSREEELREKFHSVEFKLVLHFKCHSQKTMQYFRDGKFPNTIFAIIMT